MLIQNRSCLLWMQRRHPHPLSWSARGLDSRIFKTPQVATHCQHFATLSVLPRVATSCHELNKWFLSPKSAPFQHSKDQVTWQLTSRWQAMDLKKGTSCNLQLGRQSKPSPQGRVPIDVQPLCRMEHCPNLCQLTRSGVRWCKSSMLRVHLLYHICIISSIRILTSFHIVSLSRAETSSLFILIIHVRRVLMCLKVTLKLSQTL